MLVENKDIETIQGYYRYLFNSEPTDLTLRKMCKSISEEIENFESEQEGYDNKIDCCVNQDQEMCQQIGFEKENCIEFLEGNQCLSLISGKDFKDLMINELFVFNQDNQRYCFELELLVKMNLVTIHIHERKLKEYP